MNVWNRIFSEFVGTFCLVFFGCGAVAVDGIYGGVLGSVGVSLAFGLVIMIMIYAVGNISGAHFNPAVTIGFFFARRLKAKRIAPYILSQFAGALSAAGVLRLLFPESQGLGMTEPAGGLWTSALVEVLLTFVLMFVILNVSSGHMEKGIMAGVAIGGTVALAALAFGPISGASMNPARSLGPAAFSWRWQDQWIYMTAPVMGAALASPMCRLIQGKQCCDHIRETGSPGRETGETWSREELNGG